MKLLKVLSASFLCASMVCAFADQNTQKTSAYFESIKNNPEQLQIFLEKMPKGGDLHNHIDGAAYAEDLLNDAKQGNFCVNPQTLAIYQDEKCPARYQIKNILTNQKLYDQIIDAWSMRNFPLNSEAGEQHFFAAFPKFEPLVIANLPEVIAQIADTAARQHETYLELMIGDMMLQAKDKHGQTSMDIGAETGEQKDLAAWRDKLLQAGIQDVIANADQRIKQLNQQVNQYLECQTAKPSPGCQVTIRYQYFVLRDIPIAQFYAQLVTAFGVAATSPSVVGINLVMPENWNTALTDYTRQMRMVGFLHQRYPRVNITLHAGELAFGQVPAKDLSYHIDQAVNIAHAQRIGHGTDIAYETRAKQLLREMAKKHIDVEINLTSNADVLDVSGKNHPLPLYLRYHVPVTLSTDDEGIERTTLTQEYKRAVQSYDFSYLTLKNLARNSITYSFLPGQSLWRDPDHFIPVTACKDDSPGTSNSSAACQVFLDQSEKARKQWQLEKQFSEFEKLYKSEKFW